jgi:hypothetical protein
MQKVSSASASLSRVYAQSVLDSRMGEGMGDGGKRHLSWDRSIGTFPHVSNAQGYCDRALN